MSNSPQQDQRPLVVHVVYRFGTGGMENGVVNLINKMPAGAYRHIVLALTEVTEFRQRIAKNDVEFISLHKPPGHVLWLYPRLIKLFRELKPAIVHTRNLGTLEVAVAAKAAGVPIRIHGEHGWDIGDVGGSRRKYQWVRKIYQPFVTKYIVLSNELEEYLLNRVGVPRRKISKICNGVDAEKFYPRELKTALVDSPFSQSSGWIVGTVGRMQPVKDQTTLVRAFIRALELAPELVGKARLVMVGDGPLRKDCQDLLKAADLEEYAWLPGERNDVAVIMGSLNCFVLPSLAEGISNTILEAMASGLPVIATDVGGSGELVVDGETGKLVPPDDSDAMARAIVEYAKQPASALRAGQAGRLLVEQQFSLDAMVGNYQQLYDGLTERAKIDGKVAG